jgi:archaellum component FlaC
MDLFSLISDLLKEYDIITVGIITTIGIILYKKLTVVDNAVNCRKKGALTLSQEVSEIHRKVDVLANEIDHIKQDVIEHREEDERIISSLTNNIEELNSKITSIKAKVKRKTPNNS